MGHPLDMVKAYEEEHGYILEGGPTPLWRDYQEAQYTDDGELVVTTKTGAGKEAIETTKEALAGPIPLLEKAFYALVVLLVLLIVAGIVW